jgi:hypothetical protein
MGVFVNGVGQVLGCEHLARAVLEAKLSRTLGVLAVEDARHYVFQFGKYAMELLVCCIAIIVVEVIDVGLSCWMVNVLDMATYIRACLSLNVTGETCYYMTMS